jgi:hypothetical protein
MNKDAMEELANALLDAETLAGPALDVFLQAVRPWPHPLVPGLNGSAATIVMRGEASEIDEGSPA